MLRRIKNILTTRYIFSKPYQVKYLLIDSITKPLVETLDFDDDYLCIDIRGESVNLYVLFLSLLFYPSLSFKKIYINYIQTFIKLIKPKYLITFNDTNPYLLNLNFPENIYFLIIQNGYRYKKINFLKKDASSNIIFLTMTKSRADFLQTYNKKTYVIGSVLSNAVPKFEKVDKKKIVFISQYRNIYGNKERVFLAGLKHKQVYKYEKKILKILIKVLRDTDYRLIILGSRPESENSQEYEFYKKYINNKNIFFIPRIEKNIEKFNFLDNASHIVGLDSTLLYECLGRGKKTFFATCRGYLEFGKSVNPFLYPLKNSDFGLFWANVFSDKKIFSCLQNFIKTDFSLEEFKRELPFRPKLNSMKKIISHLKLKYN